jgi:hypothetical protein
MGDPVRATLNGEKIHVSDWKAAHDEYEYVMTIPAKNDPQGRPIGALILPSIVRNQMQAHPDLYYLLVREAQHLGIRVPQEKVESVLTKEITLPANFTLDDETALRQAITHLLAIDTSLLRAVTPIKISQPLREQFLAQRYQAIKVKIAEFDVSEFKPLTPAPTTQQVQDQFTTYGNKDPQAPDPHNTFAFGYRLPNRVKFQWIELRRSDLLNAAKAIHSAYDWDVEAQKYYRLNPQEFPTTAPTSQPIVTKNSAERPFNEVHQQILDKLQNAEADRLESAILARMTSLMNADYSEYKANPISPPKTSLDAPYADYSYLEKLAARIQSEFKILPAVVSMGDYKTQKQIADTGLGKASVNSTDAATYLTTQIEPLAPADMKSRTLKLLQPSPTMRDDAGNVYIARVLDAQAARMPGNIADVKPEIENDLRTASAFKLASDAARRLASAAHQSDLEKAAALAGRKTISAGPFSPARMEIPGYSLPPESTMQFIYSTSGLLQTDPRSTPHPLTVVELPRVGKVDVVELQDVIPAFNPNDKVQMAEISTSLDEEIMQRYASQFLQKWFDYDQIAERLNYHVDESSMKLQKNPTPSNEPPPQPSPFQ